VPEEVVVLLVGKTPVPAGGFERADVHLAGDLDADDPVVDGSLDGEYDVVVAGADSVAAAVEQVSAPVVAATDDPSAALSAGADEVVPTDAPPEVVANRVRTVAERRSHRDQVEGLLADPLTARAVVDADGHIHAVNDTALAFSGEQRDAVLGEPLWEQPWVEHSSASAETYRAAIEQAMAGRAVRERVEARDDQGAVRSIDVVVRPLSDDRVVVEGRDVGMVLDEDAALEPPSRRLRTVVENLPVVLFALDSEGTFTLSEGRGLRKLGLEPGEVVGDSVFDVYGDVPEICKAAERALDGEAVNHQIELDDVAFETWYQPVSRAGEVRSVLGVAIDVTERVDRERELERYRTLVETVGDPMYVLDTSGTIEMVNEAMAEHLGYDREELVGEHVSLVLAEGDVAAGEEVIAELLADEDRRWGTYELTVIDAEGERTRYEDHVGVITDEDGTFAGSVGVVRNLEDRLARERELEQYETIVETVPDGVFVLDEEGVMLEGNETAAAMFGYDREALEGEPFVSLVEEGLVEPSVVDRYVEVVRDILSSGSESETDRFEFEVYPPDGGQRIVEVRVALRSFDEEFRGTIGVIRDVTEHRERERQLQRQNERLEEFASVVSHDLRNPLSVARGTADLLAEDVDAGELDQLRRSLRRMDELIEELLELARTGQTVTEFEPVELDEVAADAWSTVDHDDAGLAVRTDAVVEAHRSRLRQLLENLFRNAAEHAGDTPRGEVGDLDDGRGFYVADDGPGIPADERDRVLEYGYTTAEDGTGFGLAIVRSVAEAHGWELRLADGEDGGARFEFRGVDPAE
jgi:PAS domain S-box-containing protein